MSFVLGPVVDRDIRLAKESRTSVRIAAPSAVCTTTKGGPLPRIKCYRRRDHRRSGDLLHWVRQKSTSSQRRQLR